MTRNRQIAAAFSWAAVATAVALGVGCSGTPPTASGKAMLSGSTIRVWCGDERYRAEFGSRLTTWANRNGAAVTVDAAPTADVLLLSPAELGAAAAAGDLLPVPATVTGPAAEFQWTGLLRVYQSSLVRWGVKEYAVPLVGDGYVLVFRADRLDDPAPKKAFVAKHQREPLPIRTWEDLTEVAAFFAADGKPSLPPLPPSAADALTAFAQIAACYDRPPVNSAVRSKDDDTDYVRLGLSFLVNGETGVPRITAPSFAEAFRWFHATADLRPKAPGDPFDAVVSRSAVAAVLPLSDLHRLPRDAGGAVDPKFGVAGVPGTKRYFDAKDKPQDVPSGNFVPYCGGGGMVGAVRKTATNPEACWSLLAELGGPGGSANTVDSAKLGGGPLRSTHLNGSGLWRQYRFDEARTAELGKALERYAPAGLQNPAIALRTPDQAAVTELIVTQVRRAAAGEATAEQAVQKAADGWAELDAKTPEAERRAWRRKAAGLE